MLSLTLAIQQIIKNHILRNEIQRIDRENHWLRIQSLQPNGLWFSGLVINSGKRKLEIKRGKGFDENLQDKF